MSLKFKLMLIILVMILAVIGSLLIINLTKSRSTQITTTYQYADMLAKSSAVEIQRQIETFTDCANMLSLIFSEYESTAENNRRDSFNDLMRGTIQQNALILGIWTAWLPDTVDGMDQELGQYQSFFTRRRTGEVEQLSAGYEGWRNYLADMSGKPEIASPVWRDVFGHGNVPVISVMYPVKNLKGELVGLIGINYVSDMDAVVDELVKEIYNGKGVAAVYANDGVIIAHFVKEQIKNNIKNSAGEKELLGDQHDRIVESIKNGGENGNPVIQTRFSPVLNTNLRLIYQPIFISGMDTPWNIMLGIPVNEITRPVRETTYFSLIFAAIILAAAAVITFFVARGVVGPILNVTNTLKDISEGEGDLTRRIANNSKDEVGDLSRYFNLTLDKIKNLIIIIKKEAVTLAEIGNDLASNMNQTAAAVNQITANIQSVKGRVLNQSASVSQTHATMEQLTGNINKLDEHVENQNSNVARASAAVEEMVANIQSVTSTLVNNAGNVKTLINSSEAGRSGLLDVSSDIQEISRESEGLLEINSVMNNIASQTNLLSMNAAIEAAHAGEAGKGFAVVADEIRKLAESSSEQSKVIGAVLKKIKGSIDKITLSNDNVMNKFEAIDASVRIVAEQEEVIRNAMEEQEVGSKQILDGILEVTEITREVKGGSNEMLNGAKEVITESANLEKMTQEITFGVNEMASGAEEINVAVNMVNEMSGKTREGINILLEEVSRFKVDS